MFGDVQKRIRYIRYAATVPPCIVTVGLGHNEVMRVTALLTNGSVLEYQGCRRLRGNPPQGDVEMFLISASDDIQQHQKLLRWVARNWYGCPVTVIADTETETHEIVSRGYGAWFLRRPIADDELRRVIQSVAVMPPMSL